MKTQDLIKQLSANARPVKPLAAPELRFVLWMAMALGVTLCCMFIMALIGVKFLGQSVDWVRRLSSPALWLPGALTLLMCASVIYFVFALSVPGKKTNWLGFTALALAVAWIVSITAPLFFRRLAPLDSGLLCVAEIVVLTLIPGIVLLRMLKRAAPLATRKIGALAILGSLALSAAGSLFLCGDEDPLHELVWHFLPVIILTISGLYAGRYLFSYVNTLKNNAPAQK